MFDEILGSVNSNARVTKSVMNNQVRLNKGQRNNCYLYKINSFSIFVMIELTFDDIVPCQHAVKTIKLARILLLKAEPVNRFSVVVVRFSV